MQGLWFEDFKVGDRFETAGYTFTESAIVDFALKYDPQPFHMDRIAAETSTYGGLIASGFHTLSVAFRMMYQEGCFQTANLGGRGLDELRWTRAVRPGDTIRTVMEVVETRPSSMQDRGNLRIRFTTTNQDGDVVMTGYLMPVIARRAPAA